jgi:transposase
VKILWWDRHGFWLAYKRLERARFPSPAALGAGGVAASELVLWLEGVDLLRTRGFARVSASRVA